MSCSPAVLFIKLKGLSDSQPGQIRFQSCSFLFYFMMLRLYSIKQKDY
jgi:hypothetical protein